MEGLQFSERGHTRFRFGRRWRTVVGLVEQGPDPRRGVRLRPFSEEPSGPGFGLLVEERIIHHGQGLCGHIGHVAPTDRAERSREVEGLKSRRQEVASKRGVQAPAAVSVERATQVGTTAANDELGEMHRHGRASQCGIETARDH
jgi:hypothetical protein